MKGTSKVSIVTCANEENLEMVCGMYEYPACIIAKEIN